MKVHSWSQCQAPVHQTPAEQAKAGALHSGSPPSSVTRDHAVLHTDEAGPSHTNLTCIVKRLQPRRVKEADDNGGRWVTRSACALGWQVRVVRTSISSNVQSSLSVQQRQRSSE